MYLYDRNTVCGKAEASCLKLKDYNLVDPLQFVHDYPFG